MVSMDATLIFETLRGVPADLRTLPADLTSAQAWTPREPGKWAIGEVLRRRVPGDRDPCPLRGTK